MRMRSKKKKKNKKGRVVWSERGRAGTPVLNDLFISTAFDFGVCGLLTGAKGLVEFSKTAERRRGRRGGGGGGGGGA